MGFNDHVKRGHPIVFGLIIFFSMIELAISAWLVSHFNKHRNYTDRSENDRTRFLLFASIWTLFFSVGYTVLFWIAPSSVLASVASHGIVLFFTWLFWTAGAAAITAELGGGLNCSTQNTFVYCGQLNALEGFAWVIWVLVTFAIIVVFIRGVTAARRGDGFRGPLRSV